MLATTSFQPKTLPANGWEWGVKEKPDSIKICTICEGNMAVEIYCHKCFSYYCQKCFDSQKKSLTTRTCQHCKCKRDLPYIRENQLEQKEYNSVINKLNFSCLIEDCHWNGPYSQISDHQQACPSPKKPEAQEKPEGKEKQKLEDNLENTYDKLAAELAFFSLQKSKNFVNCLSCQKPIPSDNIELITDHISACPANEETSLKNQRETLTLAPNKNTVGPIFTPKPNAVDDKNSGNASTPEDASAFYIAMHLTPIQCSIEKPLQLQLIYAQKGLKMRCFTYNPGDREPKVPFLCLFSEDTSEKEDVLPASILKPEPEPESVMSNIDIIDSKNTVLGSMVRFNDHSNKDIPLGLHSADGAAVLLLKDEETRKKILQDPAGQAPYFIRVQKKPSTT